MAAVKEQPLAFSGTHRSSLIYFPINIQITQIIRKSN